ncbi:MAG: LAGLIDADG family homing endonuclease [archaeon]|nr:MAG: LAGLIDADG family homing endonuclease [archaeon]
MWSKKEKGYIFGLFAGDGYSYHNKKDRHYTVEFYLNSIRDKDIEKYLVSILKKRGFIVHLSKDKRFNCKRIRVHSKEFFQEIKDNCCIVTKDYKLGFVSGLIDAEGYVSSKKSMITVTNTNKRLLLKLKRFLKEFGVNSSIKKKKKGWKEKLDQYILHVSIKFKSLNHVSKKAGRK